MVLIHDPRQCGKTTLAKAGAEELGFAYFSFDNDVQREAAEADPVGYVAELPERAVLDELPPWHSNHLKRLIKTPKLLMVDTGMACAVPIAQLWKSNKDPA